METLLGVTADGPLAPEIAGVVAGCHGVRLPAHGGELWARFGSADAAVGAARQIRQGHRVALAMHGSRHVAAQLLHAAHVGQILLAGETREQLHDDGVTFVDLGAYHLGDAVTPLRVFGVVEQWALDGARPPKAQRLRLGELPEPTERLIGRERDVDELDALLRQCRLVTLTGVGGTGKTRLAIEVARRGEARWRDGVWLARLDGCRRRGDVEAAVLAAVAVDLAGAGTDAVEALVQGLRHRHALVVVDNCEHVLDTVAGMLTEVLARCRDVRVLATSRRPIGVAGEHVRRVEPLDAADDGAAVELFVERAEAVGERVDLAADRAVIGRICRRVDGIPLAVELAAARARVLRLPDLLAALDRMGPLLDGGPGAPPRHRTLGASLRWSSDLLGASARLALGRAAVFRGGFRLDAATAVLAGGPIAAGQVLGLLDELVDASLILTDPSGPGTRFRLLEPVRQFAAGLLAANDAAQTRERHTDWYAGLIGELGTRWRAGDDQGTWPVAAAELGNLRAAFDRLAEAGRIDDAERFAVDAYGPVDNHVEPLAEMDWAPRALAIDPDHVGPWTAAACALAAWGVLDAADFEPAAVLLRRGEAAIERGSVDDGLLVACALHHLRFGGSPPLTPGFITDHAASALRGDDLHRRVWVASYVREGEVAVEAAERLGNVMLLALARSTVARGLLDGDQRDGPECWDAIECFWDAALQSHCAVMADHAAQMLGDARIRTGAVVDGLLLQRAPLRGWYLSADVRVWDVLRSIATGLALAGDAVGAARLVGALGERRAVFSTAGSVADCHARIDAVLPADVRRRHAAAGRRLGLGDLVAEALQRIEALAVRAPGAAGLGRAALTARQRAVAALVAEGASNKRIAAELGISRLTAETHVRNVLERLGASSRAQIAAWWAAGDT